MLKFIHCADLHLDSPLRGLAQKMDAPVDEIRLATRRALTNLVDLCIQESVDFLVIAGDIYDGDWQDYSTGLFFNREMGRLRNHHIPVYIIRGNHDAASNITKNLQLPDNVYEFSMDHPETILLDELKVALHGMGYKEREVWNNIALEYPDPVPGYFNIGLLHTSLEGQDGHERYAPCRLEELVQKGYDYWALGHIHKREILHTDPYIIFPGNIQGRHVRETGNKGCYLVKIQEDKVIPEYRDLDVMRWFVCSVDLSDIETEQELLGIVENQLSDFVLENPGMPLAIRIELFGNTPLHHAFLKDPERYRNEFLNIANLVSQQIWIEKVKFMTSSPGEWKDDPERKDALNLLAKSVGSSLEDEEFIEAFLGDIKNIQNRISSYIKREDARKINSVEDVTSLIREAKDLLFSGMLKGGGKG